jgi:hypothetical protein
MLYFNTLPKILTVDNNNNVIKLTNLLARSTIVDELLKDPMLFYNYTVQEGDTPEIVAGKYYGDQYRYWLVLFANQMMDPQWDWPLPSTQFNDYLTEKYSSAATSANVSSVLLYTQSTPQHYTKTITTTESASMKVNSKTIVIDLDTYNNLQTGTTSFSFSDGNSVSETITSDIVSIFEYESSLNDAKRNIKLINSSYAPQLEAQFMKLMSK